MDGLPGDAIPGRYLGFRGAAEAFHDGVEPLFHNAQLRESHPAPPARNSQAKRGPGRPGVKHQPRPSCQASTGTGQRARDERVQTFCTSSRRPETGRSRRRLGARRPPLALGRAHASTPVGWRGERKPRAAETTGQGVSGAVGRQPAGRPSARRGALLASAASRPSRVAVTAPPAGALRLRDGRDRRRVAVRGWLRGHPVCRRPGQAEQTAARARQPSVRPSRPS